MAMTPQEAIDTLRVAIAEVEWNYPLDYAVAMEMGIEALEKEISMTPVHCGSVVNTEICPYYGKPINDDNNRQQFKASRNP